MQGRVASQCELRLQDGISAGRILATRSRPPARSSPTSPASPSCASRSAASTLTAGQPGTQARLLGELAGGVVALKSALEELGKWNDTLVLTYAEFGRRPKENLSNGTDHGTASAHFALGGRVAGGLYGEQAALDRLSGDGNPGTRIDFRERVRDRARPLVGRAIERTAQAEPSRRYRSCDRRCPSRQCHHVGVPRRDELLPMRPSVRRAIFSRASDTSAAYSPAVSAPRSC